MMSRCVDVIEKYENLFRPADKDWLNCSACNLDKKDIKFCQCLDSHQLNMALICVEDKCVNFNIILNDVPEYTSNVYCHSDILNFSAIHWCEKTHHLKFVKHKQLVDSKSEKHEKNVWMT